MIYAYIRVSTEKQDYENQKFKIQQFCLNENIKIDCWINETISGTKDTDERKLGKVLKKMQAGDILIAIELSRLGRSLLMIMSILNECMKKDIKVWTIRDNYRLGNDISSKVLAFAFGLSAEIERNLISQRTKEALERKRAEGVILGRPKGRKASYTKCSGKEKQIFYLMLSDISQRQIAKKIKVNRNTLARFLINNSTWNNPPYIMDKNNAI